MKLAIVHNLPPGGGRRSAFEWMKVLRRSADVDLYTFDDEDKFCDLSGLASNTFKFGIQTRGRGIFSKFLSLVEIELISKRMAKIINLKNYDAVLVLNCRVANSPPILRSLQGKVVFYCQEPAARVLEPHYPLSQESFIVKILRQLFVLYDGYNAAHSPEILCNSRFSMESLYRSYKKYPQVVYLGIDPDLFTEKPVLDKNRSFVLSVGHLTQAKGHDFVISALSKVDEAIRPSFYIVYKCENPGYRDYLLDLARKKGVDVVLLGSVSDSDLVTLYGTAKVVICAARLEPLGLSPLEAMACGTPVLGVAEGGIRETVISGFNGLLVDRDENEFSVALMKMYSDDTFYSLLANNCRSHVTTNWSWVHSGRKIMSVLSK